MTTNAAASPRVIAPRGISRIAVRGLSASWRASASRLNPIAALRALTMQTTIHATCDQENGWSRHASSAPVSANGSAKTEWLKRTNEKYVESLVTLGVGLLEVGSYLVSSQVIAEGSTPPTRYSSTSLTPSGTRTEMSWARLPASMLPRSSPNPRALAPRSVALSRSDRAVTRGSHPPRRGELGEEVQILHACEAVGTERDVHVHRVKRLERRRADADVPVAARARHDRHVERAEAIEIVTGQLHAVHGKDAAIEEAEVLEILHRRRPRRLPCVGPCTQLLQERSPGARATPEELHFLGRFSEMHARHLAWMRVEVGANRGEQARRDRVRRVRRQADPHHAAAPRRGVRLRARLARDRPGIGRVESQQLVEDLRGHARLAQQRHRDQRVRNVADEAGPARARFGNGRPRRGEHVAAIRIRVGRARRHHRADPVEKPPGRRDRAPQMRQLEMGMRVDQRGHDGDAAEIEGARVRPLPYRFDAAVLDAEGTAMNGARR